MSFVIKFAKGVRNHWKKSTFAAALVTYGASYANDKAKINKLMREYCLEASVSGDATASVSQPPKRVLVLLNPAANRRSAEETFKKYCEPILHLAGFLVDIVKTDSEGHARRHIEQLTSFPSAIVVAGGDGTLSEVVTGMMRKIDSNEACPIGILPVGRTNASCAEDFPRQKQNRVEEARQLAEAAISIVRGNVARKNVMKIEVVSTEEEEYRRPVYAVGSFQWGAFRDILSLRDQYWYTGPFREYMAFLVNSFSSRPTWECEADIRYTPPCTGCRNCGVTAKKPNVHEGRWWTRFLPRNTVNLAPGNDFSKVVNEMCSKEFVIEGKHSEVIIQTAPESLRMKLAELEDSAFSYILKSWKRLRGIEVDSTAGKEPIEARTVQILPGNEDNPPKDKYYAIDNEEYDVKPIKITLLPRAINMFSPEVAK
ncbi:acylglycerol kinase, mitochondrial [Phlebotomus papatasi]|uniref:acylglycerol kinase, mitochondrial n=1 Tax=Phlebotomus papatasi TaxID=29031 RepID=UPI0024840E5D|nr:acylglycerol kinase, mitochondrial [Phlebotomus papatasi]